jgi:ACR3 family arsenite efflux pump ArsB
MSWKARLAPYGRLGLMIYLGTTCVSMVVFGTLLHLGFRDPLAQALASVTGVVRNHLGSGLADALTPSGNLTGTTLVAAYVLTKLVQVPRILFTVAVTPWVARRLARESGTATAEDT